MPRSKGGKNRAKRAPRGKKKRQRTKGEGQTKEGEDKGADVEGTGGTFREGASRDTSPTTPKTKEYSANWKALVKQLGLAGSGEIKKGVRRRTGDGGKQFRPSGGKGDLRTSSTAAAKRKRVESGDRKWEGAAEDVVEVKPEPKRKKMEAVTPSGSDTSLGKCVALDCEMVGTGPEGDFSMLARCSIVNHHGNILYDSYVAPMDTVTDYRTAYSGIRPKDLEGAFDLKSVQTKVSEFLRGRLLVGHALRHDLKALLLSHPRRDIRDTSRYRPLRKLSKGKTPSLKKLALQVLGIEIQGKEHDSVEDARVAMRLYQLHKVEWERAIRARGDRRVEGRGRGGGGGRMGGDAITVGEGRGIGLGGAGRWMVGGGGGGGVEGKMEGDKVTVEGGGRRMGGGRGGERKGGRKSWQNHRTNISQQKLSHRIGQSLSTNDKLFTIMLYSDVK